jgi:hypothetical protein
LIYLISTSARKKPARTSAPNSQPHQPTQTIIIGAAAADALHAAYFAALAGLFARYRHCHPHFANAELVFAFD